MKEQGAYENFDVYRLLKRSKEPDITTRALFLACNVEELSLYTDDLYIRLQRDIDEVAKGIKATKNGVVKCIISAVVEHNNYY